jgi:hypothetical protein
MAILLVTSTVKNDMNPPNGFENPSIRFRGPEAHVKVIDRGRQKVTVGTEDRRSHGKDRVNPHARWPSGYHLPSLPKGTGGTRLSGVRVSYARTFDSVDGATT